MRRVPETPASSAATWTALKPLSWTMKRWHLLSMPFCLPFVAAVAIACSPPLPLVIGFELNSAALSIQATSALRPVVEKVRKYGPKCSSMIVVAATTGGVAGSVESNLDAERVDRIKSFLIEQGVGSELIKTSVAGGPPGSRVQVDWYGASGRVLCDPTSKNPDYTGGANCQPEYTRCIVQLPDGTVCNFGNVPDPNPARYSVGR